MWHTWRDVGGSNWIMKYLYCTYCTEAYLSVLHFCIAESHAALTRGQASDLLWKQKEAECWRFSIVCFHTFAVKPGSSGSKAWKSPRFLLVYDCVSWCNKISGVWNWNSSSHDLMRVVFEKRCRDGSSFVLNLKLLKLLVILQLFIYLLMLQHCGFGSR